MKRLLGFSFLGVLSVAGCSSSSGGSSDGSALPMCTSTSETSPAMSPATFCAIYIASCGTSREGYGSMAECVATYGALTTTKPNRQMCQSSHLCTAVSFEPGDIRDNHCGHATGFPGNRNCEQLN